MSKHYAGGLRAQYLAAVQANLAARRRYEATLARVQDEPTPSDLGGGGTSSSSESSALLGRHLELLRLQQQNASLVLLQDELERVQRSRGGFAALPARPDLDETCSTSANAANDTDAQIDSVTRSLKALEMAVIQAHHEYRRQKSRLEETKTKTQGLPSPSPKQRMHALSMTRKELTAWLEDGLETCQQGSGLLPDASEAPGLEDGNSISETMIDDRYEQYLDARRRLLSAAQTLRDPLLRETSDDLGKQHDEPATKGKANSHIQAPDESALLNTIEKVLLPASQLESASQAQLVFAQEELESETTTTINMLDRFSDESQLLQAFPVLARSGRFEHAAGAFGKKAAAQEETTDGLSRRIQPWLFAAEAADVASTAAIEMHLSQGAQAIESVAQSLAELRLLHQAQG